MFAMIFVIYLILLMSAGSLLMSWILGAIVAFWIYGINAKEQFQKLSYYDHIFLINVGFISIAVLAIVFRLGQLFGLLIMKVVS